MTIDKEQLKALALAATPGPWVFGGAWVTRRGDKTSIADCSRGDERYIAAANPATVLALLDEIERLEKDGTAMLFEAAMKAVAEQRDRLKAECEGLRKSIKLARHWCDSALRAAQDVGVASDSIRDIECLLRHQAKDIDAAMAKEAGHD